MQGDIVIQGRVYAAGTEPVGDRPQAQHPGGVTDRESHQCHRGHRDTDGGDLSGSYLICQPVAEKAGDDRSGGNDHGKQSGNRCGDKGQDEGILECLEALISREYLLEPFCREMEIVAPGLEQCSERYTDIHKADEKRQQ